MIYCVYIYLLLLYINHLPKIPWHPLIRCCSQQLGPPTCHLQEGALRRNFGDLLVKCPSCSSAEIQISMGFPDVKSSRSFTKLNLLLLRKSHQRSRSMRVWFWNHTLSLGVLEPQASGPNPFTSGENCLESKKIDQVQLVKYQQWPQISCKLPAPSRYHRWTEEFQYPFLCAVSLQLPLVSGKPWHGEPSFSRTSESDGRYNLFPWFHTKSRLHAMVNSPLPRS